MAGIVISLPKLGISVTQGSTFYADVHLNNTTGSSQTKDIMVAFGTHTAGTFNTAWRYVHQGVSIPPGISTHTFTCTAEQVGTWDVLAAIGTYNPTTGEFIIENSIIKDDELTVTTAGVVEVTDVVLHT